MDDRWVISLDCGSTNFKGAIFASDLGRMGEISLPMEYEHHGPERYEFSPEMIRRHLAAAIDSLCSQANISPGDITDISLTSQAQTFTLLADDGQILSPFISWMDRVAVRQSEELSAVIGEDFHQHCSFGELLPQLQVSKMRQRAMLAEKTSRVVSLPSYIVLLLGGPFAMDENLAAMSGLYSLARRAWYSEALKACGFVAEQMPKIVSLGDSVLSERGSEYGIRKGTKITFAGNDHTSGAWGNTLEEGELLVTLGTALVAYRCVGNRPGPYHSQSFWGPYTKGRFYELATLDAGCLSQDWARRQMDPKMGLAEFDALAESCLEDLSLENTYFYPERIGEKDVWSQSGTRSEQAYSVLEGIAFALRKLIETDLQISRSSFVLKIMGGGAKSGVWRRIIATILNVPVLRVEGDGLLGAASFALKKSVGRKAVTKKVGADSSLVPLLEKRYEQWKKKR